MSPSVSVFKNSSIIMFGLRITIECHVRFFWKGEYIDLFPYLALVNFPSVSSSYQIIKRCFFAILIICN